MFTTIFVAIFQEFPEISQMNVFENFRKISGAKFECSLRDKVIFQKSSDARISSRFYQFITVSISYRFYQFFTTRYTTGVTHIRNENI